MELSFPLILDGATGTELQKHGFGGGDCPEAWILEHPEQWLIWLYPRWASTVEGDR